MQARDEYCIYCGQLHPNYTEGCINIKQADIIVVGVKRITTVKHSIKSNCPYCNELYELDLLENDNNLHVMCVNCKKYFKAVRLTSKNKTNE
jgi:Zn ribbon nucleic-acid-binding protein